MRLSDYRARESLTEKVLGRNTKLPLKDKLGLITALMTTKIDVFQHSRNETPGHKKDLIKEIATLAEKHGFPKTELFRLAAEYTNAVQESPLYKALRKAQTEACEERSSHPLPKETAAAIKAMKF